MIDDQFNQQKSGQNNLNSQQSGQNQTGSLQKEQEMLPSATANFSELELPAENSIESEPPVSENSSVSSTSAVQPAGGNPANTTQQQQTSAQAANPGHMQHLLTKEQAQQIVKGPLMFKNSSDPMLWLAFLLLRHYQLLEKEEKSNK